VRGSSESDKLTISMLGHRPKRPVKLDEGAALSGAHIAFILVPHNGSYAPDHVVKRGSRGARAQPHSAGLALKDAAVLSMAPSAFSNDAPLQSAYTAPSHPPGPCTPAALRPPLGNHSEPSGWPVAEGGLPGALDTPGRSVPAASSQLPLSTGDDAPSGAVAWQPPEGGQFSGGYAGGGGGPPPGGAPAGGGRGGGGGGPGGAPSARLAG